MNHVINKSIRRVVLKITIFKKKRERSEAQITDCMCLYMDLLLLIF